MLIYAMYLSAIGLLLPHMGDSFHLGMAVSSRLCAVDFSAFVVGVLVCGWLSDRYGRKAVLLSSLFPYAAGLALFGASRSFNVVLLASVLVGAGTGAMETVASALASDIYPECRAFILNAIQVGFGVGAAVSPALTQSALEAGVGWRSLYFGLCVVTLLLFLILAVQRVPAVKAGAEAVEFSVLIGILRRPFFLLLCLANVLYVACETGFFSWMPTYFTRSLPGGAAYAGLVVTVFWVAMTVGRTATSAALHRMPLLRLLLLLGIGGALGAALALVWQSPLVVEIWVAVTGLCFSGIFGLLLAVAGERYPEIAGTAFGGVVAAGGVGGAVGPWMVGVLGSTALSWRSALLTIPIMMTAFTLILLVLVQRSRIII